MFKECWPAGRAINTAKASEVLTLNVRSVAMTKSCLGNYALKQIGVWEIITFLPIKEGDFVGMVRFQEVEAKALGVWMMKAHTLNKAQSLRSF